ncbi:MAG TPA: glycosyltransferase, partial [Sphingomicrobium sp.]
MAAAPFVTVAVCTRDRPAELDRLLASVAELRVPGGLRWELLIVDNGSGDSVEAIVTKYRSRLPLRLIREPVPGLSNARNRGVAEARGTYICWTDDDTMLSAGWLNAYVGAFQRHPECVVFGGPIRARLEEPAPRWVRASLSRSPLAAAFAHLEIDQEKPIASPREQSPWGANFAIRTAEQRQLRYDPQLGRSPHHARLGEECDLIVRLMDRGATGYWVPDAMVDHCIPLARQTRRQAWAYFTSVGETLQHCSPDAAKRWGAAGLALRVGAYGVLFGIASVLRFRRHATICMAR